MPLMDEFKEERASIKNQPFKKKLEYFWTYYKWWVIGGAFLLVIAISIVVNIVNRKEDVIYVAMVDIVETPGADADSAITSPFLTAHGYNTKKNTINFNTDFMFTQAGIGKSAEEGGNPQTASYANTRGFTGRESLAIYIAAGDVDAICGSDDWFSNYAYNDFFIPLENIFSSEELAAYSDDIFYIDKAVLDRYRSARDNENYDYDEAYPDPDKPEEMDEPIAIGLTLEDNELYNSNFITANGNAKHVVIGIVRNTPNTQITTEFLKYIENGGN